VTVQLWQDEDVLGFSVSDDGRGFDTVSGGTGLLGMADRLAAVGGALDVTSAVGRGTTVVGRVPVERDQR
jgi:signal transduction histidine kinase